MMMVVCALCVKKVAKVALSMPLVLCYFSGIPTIFAHDVVVVLSFLYVYGYQTISYLAKHQFMYCGLRPNSPGPLTDP